MTPTELAARYGAIADELIAADAPWDYSTVLARLAAETGRSFTSLEDDLIAYCEAREAA